MDIPSRSSSNGDAAESPSEASPPQTGAASGPSPHGMSSRTRLLFYLAAWLIVLLPFLFWWSSWFGRRLSDPQITQYLTDDKHPRHIQHALVQIGERITRHESAVRWYHELVRLSTHPVEEVRNTDAWVMGQDPAGAGFHEALLKMLEDSSPMVRGNAALSLVRFRDASGRAQIVALLQPVHIVAPWGGRIVDADRPGTAVHQGGIIAKLSYGREQTTDLRSPISGRLHSLSAAAGANVAAGEEIAVVDPGDEQVWEALRALYLIGRAEDLPAVRPYERESHDIPDRVREQALLADQAIRSRASAAP